MLTAETRDVDGKSVEVFVGSIPVADDAIIGRVSSTDIVDMETGEVLVECNEELTEESLSMLLDKEIKRDRNALYRQRHCGFIPARHSFGRQNRVYRRRCDGNLSSPSPW